MQIESKVGYANQVLETAESELAEATQEIEKAVHAAKALEEADEVAQAVYNTYPDVDMTVYGLPLAAHRPLDEVLDPEIVEVEVEEEDDADTSETE